MLLDIFFLFGHFFFPLCKYVRYAFWDVAVGGPRAVHTEFGPTEFCVDS